MTELYAGGKKLWPKIVMSVLGLLILAYCGSEEEFWKPASYIEGVPVVSDIRQEEIEALTAVVKGIRSLGEQVPEHRVIFIRSVDQEIPELCSEGFGCVGSTCASTWKELSDEGSTEPKNPAEGYRGYCSDEYVFVRRFGEAEPYLTELLRHEYTHALGYDHGKAMEAFERRLQGAI